MRRFLLTSAASRGVGLSNFSQLIEQMRKEARIFVALPVKVYVSQSSNEFQPACTYEISYKGARLVQIKGIVVDQEVWVQRQTRKAKYRVVWIGQEGTEQKGQIGLECLEADKLIWDEEVAQKLAKP